MTTEELALEVERLRGVLARIEAMVWYEPQDDDDTVDAVRAMVRERDEARAKAAAYERDWYKAKGEFGTAAAKLRDQVRTLEAALTTETRVALDYQKQRDEARAEAEVLRRERDDLYGAVMLAEERGAEWAIRVKAQVVYPLAGDASYVMLAREVCEQARAEVERLRNADPGPRSSG